MTAQAGSGTRAERPGAGSAAPGAAGEVDARVAALDVGSNAVRYVAGRGTPGQPMEQLEAERFTLRLGDDTFTTGVISEQSALALVRIAARFRERIEALAIDAYRAIATSALRESRNADAVMDRVRSGTGVELVAISGAEEARLVWVAVRERIAMGDDAWLLADLGGGSIELSVATMDGIASTDSEYLGAVRLLAEVGTGTGPAVVEHLRQAVEVRLKLPRGVDDGRGVIVTGGNAEALAGVAAAAPDVRGVRRIDASRLGELIDELAALSADERAARYALPPDRADVILPAAIIFETLLRQSGGSELIVPGVGVKEGILEELAAPLLAQRKGAEG